jgi:CRISPR system Cascade subunit CasD
MKDHLVLDLAAPLMSFGREMVGDHGPTSAYPGPSLITGLIANALGWTRTRAEDHDRLQSRIVMGAALVSEGQVLTDFQTARLDQTDGGWTTRGRPEGRAQTPTYRVDEDERRRTRRDDKILTHRRWRDGRAGARVIVAIRLEVSDEAPTLDDIASALRRPARPLFIGRKPFIPSTRILLGTVQARTVRGALWEALTHEVEEPGRIRAQWSAAEGGEGRITRQRDVRSWVAGVHAGERQVMEGVLA